MTAGAKRLPWGREVEDIAVPSRSVRYKMSLVVKECVREQCAAAGAHFVDVPAESTGPDGILREEFGRNLTHANKKYGSLVLEQIQAQL